MASFEVVPLSPAIGAEIRGLDLAEPLDAATVADLRKAWLEHLVLVFRDQKIAEDEQVRFASCFGEPVGARSAMRKDGGDPRVMLISNIREDGVPIGLLPDGELMFHSDSVFLEKPLMGATLYGVAVTREGGQTIFANMYEAYETLPADTKARLGDLKAINVFDYATQVRDAKYDLADVPHAIHPAVRTHPETGRKALYVNRLMSQELEGLPADESAALLAELYDHAEQAAFCYEHVWEKGDLVMWDNRCTMHARTDFPAHETRLLRRVGLEGDRPF